MNKEEELIDRLIDLAFAEDIGDGDHTTLSCIPATAMGKSKLLIKEPGILAGIEVATEVFRRFDPSNGSGRQGAVSVADRTPDAEHYATHEWHCYHDA